MLTRGAVHADTGCFHEAMTTGWMSFAKKRTEKVPILRAAEVVRTDETMGKVDTPSIRTSAPTATEMTSRRKAEVTRKPPAR